MVLDAGPKQSGGSLSTLLVGSALSGRLKQLANELTHQFRVTYARPNRLIPPEKVTVTSKRPELVRPRDRRGPDARAITAMTSEDRSRPRRSSRRPRSSADAAAAALVPHGRRARVAQRDRHGGPVALRHRSRAAGLQGLRGRREAGRHLLQRAPTCRSRCRCCSTPAPAWRRGCRPRRRRQSASRGRCGTQDLAEDHRLRQPRQHPAGIHQRRRTARAGHPQDVGRRVHVAVQRDLHRAEGPEEGGRHDRRGRSAARRSSCCRTARTRRACCRSRKCSIWRSGPRRRSTRSACARARAPAASRGFRRRSSCCASSRRRPAAAPSSRTRSPSSPTIYKQISDELSSQYTVGYTLAQSEAGRGVAPRRRPRRPAKHGRAHQAGLLRRRPSRRTP